MNLNFVNEYYIKGYLSDSLTQEEKSAFEAALKDQPMLQDVIEGLRPLSDLEIDLHVRELQKSLRSQMHKDRQKVKKKTPFFQQLVWIMVAVLILAIIVLGFYFVITLI